MWNTTSLCFQVLNQEEKKVPQLVSKFLHLVPFFYMKQKLQFPLISLFSMHAHGVRFKTGPWMQSCCLVTTKSAFSNVIRVPKQEYFFITKAKGKGKGIYFLLSTTSSMPLVLYNGRHTLVWTHTYTYTVKYSTHTSIHTRQPFPLRYNVFISVTHTLTLVDVVSGPRLPYSWYHL